MRRSFLLLSAGKTVVIVLGFKYAKLAVSAQFGLMKLKTATTNVSVVMEPEPLSMEQESEDFCQSRAQKNLFMLLFSVGHKKSPGQHQEMDLK